MLRTIVVGTIAVVALAFTANHAVANSNPSGNNGTVKLCAGSNCFDFVPQNQPHLPCEFRIEFRGYDEGDLEATYEVVAWPPTQIDHEQTDLVNGTVDIGEDPAGGANDLDATVDLDLTTPLQAIFDAGATPHPKQGWHVKITVHAEGSIGADVKHKVVWIEDCTTHPSPTTPPPTSPPPTTTTPLPTTTTPPPTTTTPPPTSSTPPPTTHTSPPTSPPTKTHTSRHTRLTSVQPRRGAAPPTAFTGGNVTRPIGIGALLLVLGLGTAWIARRRSA